MVWHDVKFKMITMIGGLASNKLYAQLISDVCKMPVICAPSSDANVLGACILGASNHVDFADMSFFQLIEMFYDGANHDNDNNNTSSGGGGGVYLLMPTRSADMELYHEKKYRIYLCMVQEQLKYRKIMDEIE